MDRIQATILQMCDYLLKSLDNLNLIYGAQLGGQATVHAENLVVNQLQNICKGN